MISASDLSGLSVELQSVLHIPLLDVAGTRGKNGQPVGCVVSVHGETELRVVSVLMVLYSMAGNDIGHRAAVDNEQQWS